MPSWGKSILTLASKFGRGLLSSSQQVFNSLMTSGKYDISKQIEGHKWNVEGGADGKALAWFKKYANDKDVQYKGKFMEAGKLYAFKYIKPKHHDTLAYWDRSPLVLCMGGYWASNKEYVEIGLNLHLLPKLVRRKVLIKVFEMYSKKYNGEMYSAKQRPIELNWSKIAAPLLQYGAAFCIRQYIPRLRTQCIEFKYEDWPSAIFIPAVMLHKTSENNLKNEWQKFVMNKSFKKMTASGLEKLVAGMS